MSKLPVKPVVLLMIMSKLKLSLLLGLTALILGGCIHVPTPTPTPSPVPTPVIQSTGDVDADLEAADRELGEDSDIPDITSDDLGL